jgi:hypothetical protein
VQVGFLPGSDTALVSFNPQTGLEGKFSIEYNAAALLLDGKVTLESFTDPMVMRPEVRAFMPKVKRVPMEGKGNFSGVVGYTDVAIDTKRGRFTTRQEHAPGSPEEPMTAADRVEKFMDCAGRVLGEKSPRTAGSTRGFWLDQECGNGDGGDVTEGRESCEGDGVVPMERDPVWKRRRGAMRAVVQAVLLAIAAGGASSALAQGDAAAAKPNPYGLDAGRSSGQGLRRPDWIPDPKNEKRGNTPPGSDRAGDGPASGAIVDPAAVTKK